MNNRPQRPLWQLYIETPRRRSSLVKIDTILEQRMKEFLLSRRQRQWQQAGQ